MKYSVIFFLILLISCSKSNDKSISVQNGKEVIVTTNKSSSKIAELNIDLDLKCSFNLIDSDKFVISSPSFPKFDLDGNIYIQDQDFKKMTVYKFDSQGNYINSFGKKGTGPGEFDFMGGFVVKGDTIYVSDWGNWQIDKFTLNGDFISAKKYNDFNTQPSYPKKINNGFINISQSSKGTPEGDTELNTGIRLFDNQFNHLKTFCEISSIIKKNQDYNPFANNLITAIGEKEIYVNITNEKDYKIEVYDFEGNKIREIKKSYAVTKMDDKKKNAMIEEGKKYGMNYFVDYESSVSDMKIDKFNRLWVYSAASNQGMDNDDYYDIFVNDEFIGTKRIELEKGYSFNFIEDHVVAINSEEGIIRIYNY
ncbi:MAG: 6-bladed beta-propeller [Candidatus Delongbacteria bacterium]|nr:6-bladed beta-propeller [Candidatus Delongbacteria bacterium]MBN2834421.1 6-bladed beta-propeller [Candidatus Delongbacteria bacterium]